jgi:outer membrane murein-binding lipoprotein Lpp
MICPVAGLAVLAGIRATGAGATGEVGMKTKKEEYIDKMAKQLKEWSTGIDELESRVAKTSSEVKAGYEALIKDTKKKREALSHSLHELGETSGDAWDAMKSGIEAASKELKHAIDAARDKFK